jgi:hypothetical protein
MNSQIKQQWIAALTSGEYQQTQGKLKNDNSFCCLGVLCDLYSKKTGIPWQQKDGEPIDSYRFYNETELLPLTISNWAGLGDIDNPIVEYGEEQMCISDLNDTGKSFKEIAVIIEEQL